MLVVVVEVGQDGVAQRAAVREVDEELRIGFAGAKVVRLVARDALGARACQEHEGGAKEERERRGAASHWRASHVKQNLRSAGWALEISTRTVAVWPGRVAISNRRQA